MASADQHVCEPCSRGETVSSGYSWCSDCEEILCAVCDRAHRVGKMTMSHHVTKVHDLPFIPKETIINLRFCDTHPEKIVDFYCSFHDVVCCQTCIIESHRTCQQVEVIDDVSGAIKSSAVVEDISKAVSSLLQTLNSIIENRKKNKKSVYSQEILIKTTIANLKKDLMQHVDTLEKSLLSKLDKLKEETITYFDNEMISSSSMSEKWQNIKQELDFNIEHGSNNQLFRLVEKLKYDISAVENMLKEKLTTTMNVDLKCNMRTDILSTIFAMATIQDEKQPCDIEHVSQIHRKAQFIPDMLSFTTRNPIDLSVHGLVSISGIEVIDDNLLFCNYHDRRIMKYKDDGTFVNEICTMGKPYQISLMPGGREAAVTLHDSCNILIINTENLECVRQIKAKKSYSGIQPLSDAFIVGKDHGLDIITVDGKINRSMQLPEIELVRYIHKRQDETILCTNTSKLYCVKLLDGTHVFKYKSLTEARDIAEDRYGCIYVADKGKNEIHRLAPDGSFIDVVLKGIDGIGSPLALRFSNDFSKLYVGYYQDDRLGVFLCK